MRRNLLAALQIAVLSTFFSFVSFAQELKWNTAPQKAFVFQINNTEAQKLLTRSSPDTIFNGLLYSLFDTFDVEKGWIDRPAKGHFILARIIENKLHCEYTSVFPYQVFLLKEYDALSLQVLDFDGNVREDARIKFGSRRIRIDQESKTYRVANDWVQEGGHTVTVELFGFRSVFNIEKHEVPYWYNDYYADDGPSFYSYLLTDKNRYRPNEKVRFKSYALGQSRLPLRKDLEVRVVGAGKSIKVTTVAAHRPGSYAGEFLLHDSLNLTLDNTYSLELVDRKGHIVSSTRFKFEDYELNGNKLTVELASRQQYHPAKNKLIITATDINGLILKDARATVVVKTKAVRETFQPLVILPDTLLVKEIDLDTDSATIVEIPSSLFQKSNTAYQVHVTVLNTQNQRLENGAAATHYYSQYELTSRFSNDSIIYEMLTNGVPMTSVPMKLLYDREVEGKAVHLPYKEKINPALSSIRLQGELASREILMRNLIPTLGVEGGIEKDSFKIALNNPQQLDVSWYVYQGSILLKKGFGKDLEFESFIEDRSQTYYVELLYSFGGEEQIKRKEFEFREDYLNVSLDLPERVYPGQQVVAGITVTDELGDPVGGVDLTALAVSAKLNYYIPDLPYYGKNSAPRSKRAHYSKDDITKRTAVLDLDYEKWKTRARLDTMKYYQFTYPQKTFQYTIDITDSTQFAPYVMQNGEAKRVYVIEVDRKPVYYSWVDQPKAYSFYVTECQKHEVSLRLYDQVLVLDSLFFEPCKKTIVSIDLDHLPKNITVHKMYDPTARARRRKPKPMPSFTKTEINRHLLYISEFNTDGAISYIQSRKEFTPLSDDQYPGGKTIVTAGPITPGMQTYTRYSALNTSYKHTGGYAYAFEDNIVYKLNTPISKLIPGVLLNVSTNPMHTINDLAVTRSKFLERKSTVVKWHARVIDLVDYAVRVSILLPEEKRASGIATLLFENCKTKELTSPCKNYSQGKPDFYTIPRGCQNIILLYNNGSYLKLGNVDLKSYSQIVADLNQSVLQPADSLSRTWLSTSYSNCYGNTESYTKRMLVTENLPMYGNVKGTVFDDTNMPLPGANIVIKGTVNGTVANIDGEFALDINESRTTLVVSFIGYATKEIEVQVGSEVTVYMQGDIQQLSEVVVTGYGFERTSYALRGMVSGVSITRPYAAPPDIDEPDIEEKEQSIREAEQRLYQELLTLNSIRSNFSDVGFWEPRLYTDKHGRSTFDITFPDDITRWDATVYAMNRRLQTGTARRTIKSYKPLMAELHTPQFLTRGDSAVFIGKVSNYTSDKNISGKTEWAHSQNRTEKVIEFTELFSENLAINAATTDSVTVRYAFTRNDGYFDGEERTVPVVEQGIIRADGKLSILKNKDEIRVHSSEKKTTIEILSDPLDIYGDDVRYLVDYRYACNEQLASKLVGLVNHKMLMAYESKPFRLDRDINKIITRLLRNQNQEFLWSWWDVSANTSYWMSAHILRALKTAKDAGYKVDLHVQNIVRKAEYKFDILHDYSLYDADLLNALALWNGKLNYTKHVRTLESMLQASEASLKKSPWKYRYESSLLKEKLLLQETRQLANLPYQRDTLLRYKQEGIAGDVHFSDKKPWSYWYNNDVAANTIAYRIVKRDSLLSDLIVPMQLYFLSERKGGRWNTYHSSNVFMSIFPDLLAQGATKEHPASVRLSGKVNTTINTFPFRTQLEPSESLVINKESGLPLYYMQYEEERVTVAKTGVEGFEIKTSLGDDKKMVEAGKPIALTVEVNVKKDAAFEYVMIEVPIPGACSYADKTTPLNRIETHREYFKDRTVIFCQQMTPGKYTFVVHLLPRFTGKYMMNPAQVSLMYIPVVNANTDMKVIKVK